MDNIWLDHPPGTVAIINQPAALAAKPRPSCNGGQAVVPARNVNKVTAAPRCRHSSETAH